MLTLRWSTAALLLLALQAPAGAQTTLTESFSGGSNNGNWRWNTSNTSLLPSGGWPGAFVFSGVNNGFGPEASTTINAPSFFHGDYRALGVTSLGADLDTVFITLIGSCAQPLSLLLWSDPGTPEDPSDDCYAYIVSPMGITTPCPDGIFHGYDVAIPSESTTLPAGWLIDPNCALSGDAAWNSIIQDVDGISWFFGTPGVPALLQRWDTGLDNPRISFQSPPVSYCTAGVSAAGCSATLSAAGTASATATTGFNLDAGGVEGLKDGLYFFGTSGRQANSWGSGTSFQCVTPPVSRAGLLTGSGTSGTCDGSFSQDLNALWCPTCPKPNKNPGAGAVVQAQLWYRDPLNTSNQTTSLSDAIEFTVAP